MDPLEQLGKRRRPWWLLWILVLVAGGVGGYFYLRSRNARPARRFLTARISAGDVAETVEATGTVQPIVQVQVGSQVSGRILSVLADYNVRVREGQLLAEIDPVPFRTAIAQSRAAMLAAQAQLNRARVDLALQERNFARASDLRARGLNAVADVDAARGARDAARAQIGVASADVARTRAALASAETNLSFTRIVAPINGIVISRSIDVGQTVAASFQAPTLFVIANDLSQMRVIADIDEADMGHLREEIPAEARVDAFPGEIFPGILRQLRYGPTTNQNVVTYPAVINVANPRLQLRPGMTATITIVTARHENVLRVPNAALRFRPSGSGAAGGGLRNGGGGGPGSGPGGGPGGGAPSAGGSGGSGSGWRGRGAGFAGAAGTGGPASGPGGAAVGGTGTAAGGATGEGPNGAPGGGPGEARRGRVFILENGQPRAVRVSIGITDGTFTEVSAPELRDGLEVITEETDDSSGTNARRSGGPGGPGGGGGGPRRMF